MSFRLEPKGSHWKSGGPPSSINKTRCGLSLSNKSCSTILTAASYSVSRTTSASRVCFEENSSWLVLWLPRVISVFVMKTAASPLLCLRLSCGELSEGWHAGASPHKPPVPIHSYHFKLHPSLSLLSCAGMHYLPCRVFPPPAQDGHRLRVHRYMTEQGDVFRSCTVTQLIYEDVTHWFIETKKKIRHIQTK